MTAKPVDITVEADSTFRLTVAVVTSDTDDTPVNLTGYTAKLQIRSYKGATSALATWATSTGEITIDAVNGLVLIEVTDEATAVLEWSGAAVYDLYATSGAGKRYRLIEGKARLDVAVTA